MRLFSDFEDRFRHTSLLAAAIPILSGDNGDNLLDFSTNNASNQAFGMGGNDTINLGNGDNTIYGGRGVADSNDGNDIIAVGSGSNMIYGNSGNDTITVNGLAAGHFDSLYGGSGNDVMSASGGGTLSVFGQNGADTFDLSSYTGVATVYGGGGGADSLDGGDSMTIGGGNAVVFGNGGNDTIIVATSLGHAAEISGGKGDDTITAQAGEGNILVYGGLGADSINLFQSDGNVTVFGGGGGADTTDGNDVIWIGTGNALVFANGGDDTVYIATVPGNAASVFLGAGNDVCFSFGNGGDTLIQAGLGDDTITVSNGDFILHNDSYTIDGGNGTDNLTLYNLGSDPLTDNLFTHVSHIEQLTFGNTIVSSDVTHITLGQQAQAEGITVVNLGGLGVNEAGTTSGVFTGNYQLTVYGAGIGQSDLTLTAGGTMVEGGWNGGDSMHGSAAQDTYGFVIMPPGSADGGLLYHQFGDATITQFGLGTGGQAADVFRFLGLGANGFMFDNDTGLPKHFNSIGDKDDVVEGFTKVSSVSSTGVAANAEVIVLTGVGITTAAMSASLDTINANVTNGNGVLDVVFNTTEGHAQLYYDTHGSGTIFHGPIDNVSTDNHILLADLMNITNIADMVNFDVGNFSFTF